MYRPLRRLACLAFFTFAGAATAAGVLSLTPGRGPVGTTVEASAEGLEPGATYDFVWHGATPRWLTPDGHFEGVEATPSETVILRVTADGAGRATFGFVVPEDFGYVHNTMLMAGEVEAARQGFTVTPQLSVSPTSGPRGTPITVSVTGLGYGFYQSGWHLMYDNQHTGWVTGITTRGSASFTIPATGEPGPHLLQLLSGPRRPYLNIEQSPNYLPTMAYHESVVFTLTDGPAVKPPDPAAQTLPREPGRPAEGPGPALSADFLSGTVGSPIQLTGVGFPANTEVTFKYLSVRGNRVGGGGWLMVEVPWGTARTDGAGRFSVSKPTPDDLAGERVITATAGEAEASVGYTITPHVESLTPSSVRPGETFRLVLKGTGWSDTGNIYTVVIDNAYFGYACGFNTDGTIIIDFTAPSQPGWHYIDLYPSIYEGKSGATTKTTSNDHFQLPMLNAVDHPGERLPALHLAFEVIGGG